MPDPRDRLRRLSCERRESLAALSRMIRRPDGYLAGFVRLGVPEKLAPHDRWLLAAHLGISEVELGADDPRWSRWRGHAKRVDDRKLGRGA